MIKKLTQNKTINDKTLNKIGWIASSISLLMYISLIDQIRLNLSGQKGSVILATLTTLNGIMWITYAASKPKKD